MATAPGRGTSAAPTPPAGTFAAPAPDLAGQIDLCWSAGAPGGARTSLHEFFPDAGVHLVLRLSRAGCRLVLLGPTTELASVERAAGAEYLGIRFRAGQAPRLADVRSSELTDGFVELTRLGRTPSSARRAARRAAGSRRRGSARSRTWCGQATRPLVEDPRCRRATLLLEQRRGRLRVDELAAELGLHVRSLERLFLASFAMTPKRMARLVRLRHLLGALHAGGFGTLADLAHACGYSDQPHLIRDFKVADRPPSRREGRRPQPDALAREARASSTACGHSARPDRRGLSHSHKTARREAR